MFRGSRWTALALVVSLLGCGDPSAPTAARIPLEVRLIDGFGANLVQVALDARPVFEGTVSSVPLAGPGASVHVSNAPGRHRIEIRVGGQVNATEFVLDRVTYVLVRRHDQSGEIRVTMTHDRPMYL
jgi:hypothetical protein